MSSQNLCLFPHFRYLSAHASQYQKHPYSDSTNVTPDSVPPIRYTQPNDNEHQPRDKDYRPNGKRYGPLGNVYQPDGGGDEELDPVYHMYPNSDRHYQYDQRQYPLDNGGPYYHDNRPYPHDSRPYPQDSRPYPHDSRPYPQDNRPYVYDNRAYIHDQDGYSIPRGQASMYRDVTTYPDVADERAVIPYIAPQLTRY